MQSAFFQLAITAENYLAWYQGAARVVSVIAEDGRRIEFPAEHLRPFVTHDGIFGRFVLHFDEQNRFKELKKI